MANSTADAPSERLFEDFLIAGLHKPEGHRAGTPLSIKLLYHLHKGTPEADAIVEVR